MTPTPKLRFVERVVPASIYGEGIGKKVRILQQWWAVEREGQITPTGEWRDVPLEKEA
jgi:sulfur carrier protein ThiS